MEVAEDHQTVLLMDLLADLAEEGLEGHSQVDHKVEMETILLQHHHKDKKAVHMITFHQYFHHLQVLEVEEDMVPEEAAERLEEVALAETIQLVNMAE